MNAITQYYIIYKREKQILPLRFVYVTVGDRRDSVLFTSLFCYIFTGEMQGKSYMLINTYY